MPNDPIKQSSRVDILVTPKDYEVARKDTYTSRIMKDFTPQFYAAGFRPELAGDQVVYTSPQEVLNLGGGRGRLAFVPGQGGMDLVEYTADGQVKYFDEPSHGEGSTRRLKPADVMRILNQTMAFRFNQVADDYNQGKIAKQ